jgi:hypothetical protein
MSLPRLWDMHVLKDFPRTGEVDHVTPSEMANATGIFPLQVA